MKMKLTVLSLLGLGAILPGVCFPAAAQTTQKLAVINIQQAIVETKDGQKARADLQAKFGPAQKELQDKQAKLAALQDQLRLRRRTHQFVIPVIEEEQIRRRIDIPQGTVDIEFISPECLLKAPAQHDLENIPA